IGPYASCTSPFSVGGLTDGSHTFRVRAIDVAGNIDGSPAAFTWTVDMQAPDTTIDTHPSALSSSTGAEFTFEGSGSPAGFQCSLDGGGWATCASPKDYTGLADGSHTFQTRAVDAAGNADPTPASFTWTIDTSAPDTAILSHPANPSKSSSAAFTFTAAKDATFRCSLDGATPTACTSPQTYSGLGAGSHTFTVAATDTVGNTDPTPAGYRWTIGKKPSIKLTSKPHSKSTSSSATFAFTVSDPGAELACTLDKDPVRCDSPETFTGLRNGKHTFTVTATDAANRRGKLSYGWNIKNQTK
ncbi:MAG: hypothetical protein ACRDVG_15125, partial [Jatrophihabitantaceae bacterium]